MQNLISKCKKISSSNFSFHMNSYAKESQPEFETDSYDEYHYRLGEIESKIKDFLENYEENMMQHEFFKKLVENAKGLSDKEIENLLETEEVKDFLEINAENTFCNFVDEVL